MQDDPTAATLPDPRETRRENARVTIDVERALAVTTATRYSPIRLLGTGGMGEVTLVRDETIGREVALKRLKATLDNDGRDLFCREAIMQGRLEHPSIVPVYDISQGADGELFFTMRRVRGRSLLEVLRVPGTDSRASRPRLLHAFRQICLAAQFAHEQGIVHCDIKPANIMLGDYGEVYLLDWGIARSVSEADGEGVVAGTLGYMSPEQARGERRIDARSDIYAMGALLFELLAGIALHEPGTVAEMLGRIDAGVDARPSVRAPNADVPPEIEAICVRATARDPNARYASARELSEEIERYLDGDRDLALRRRMSSEHAARAGELVARARDHLDVRSDALSTVGRALALDPANTEALAILVELLTTPPRAIPAEAVAEMQATERGFDRVRSRASAAAMALWAIGTLIGASLAGIRSVPAFAFAMVTVVAASVASLVRVRRPRPDGFVPTYQVLAIAAAIIGVGVGFNPSLITPTLALVFIIASTLSVEESRRWLPPIAGCVALVIPVLLEWLGVLGPSFVYRGDLMCIVPRMSELPDTVSARLIPLAVSIGCIVMGGLYAVRFRAVLTDVQRRNSVNAWHMRQLLPKAAESVTTLKSGPITQR